MNDAGTLPVHMLEIRELTPGAFAPYGQIVMPLKTGGQGAETGYDPENSAREAKLVLNNGEPRLWIMHLPHVGLGFSRIARHRRVTQCLGSLGGKEWLIGVAPPGTTARDLDDEARPRVEREHSGVRLGFDKPETEQLLQAVERDAKPPLQLTCRLRAAPRRGNPLNR